MKYPQLVSVCAVNVISDWLIQQLEQLGVEAPIVYSRLLLSLLHTPLQINALDLAELDLPQLKGWIGKRGGARRLTQTDTEHLKRLAAVESLMEIVSADQKKSIIEDLVNELCDKLHEIEEESDDVHLLMRASGIINDDDLAAGGGGLELKKQQIGDRNNNNLAKDSNNNDCSGGEGGLGQVKDKTRQYYQAFPALEGQSTTALLDSPRWETIHEPGAAPAMNQNSNNWPGGQQQQQGNKWTLATGFNANNINSAAAPMSNNNNPANCSNGGAKKKQKKRRTNGMVTATTNTATTSSNHNQTSNSNSKAHNKKIANNNADANHKFGQPVDLIDFEASTAAVGGGARGQNNPDSGNYFMSLPREIKSSDLRGCRKGGKARLSSECGAGGGGGLWDTNFTGTWEMEHDPIKEFIMMENQRNRRHSESDANIVEEEPKKKLGNDDSSFDNLFKMPRSDVNEEQTMLIKNLLKKSSQPEEEEEEAARNAFIEIKASSALLFDGMTIRAEGYATPDTLTSRSEADSAPPRRLYEREVSTESLEKYQARDGGQQREELDLVKFQAKFNRNVEQIWNNEEEDDSEMFHLNTFWHTYHKHRYDLQLASNNQQPSIEPIAKPFDQDEGYFYKNSIWSNSSGFSGEENLPVSNNLSLNHQPHKQGEIGCLLDQYKKTDDDVFSGSYMTPRCSADTSFWCPKEGLENFYTASSSSSMPFSSSYQSQQQQQPQFQFSNDADFEDSAFDPVVEQSMKKLNHSNGSSFVRVKRGQVGGFPARLNLPKPGSSSSISNMSGILEMGPEENLLTSDRTHFRPIRQTYLDGHTFDIPGSPDSIEYVRSESGSMFFDLEKYMEYSVDGGEEVNCNDDDEQNPTNVAITCSGSFDEDDNLEMNNRNPKRKTTTSSSNKFTLKFCVKQNEKSCQTDANDFERGGAAAVAAGASFGNFKPIQRAAVEFVEEENHNNLKDVAERFDDKWASLLPDDDQSDWSTVIGCDEDSYLSFASLPANRLMRDELTADGEEIMGDLKCIQHLYIAESDGEGANSECDPEDPCYLNNIVPDHLQVGNNGEGFNHVQQADIPIFSKDMGQLISDVFRPEVFRSITDFLREGNKISLLSKWTQNAKNQEFKYGDPNEIFWHKNWPQKTCWMASPDDEKEELNGWAEHFRARQEKERQEEQEELNKGIKASVLNLNKGCKLDKPLSDWEYSNVKAIWDSEKHHQQKESSFQEEESSFEEKESFFEERESFFDDKVSSFEDQESICNEKESSFEDKESSFQGKEESSFEEKESSFEDKESSFEEEEEASSSKKSLNRKGYNLLMLDKTNSLDPDLEREVVHFISRKRRHSASQNLHDELASAKLMDYCKCNCQKSKEKKAGKDGKLSITLPSCSSTTITCKYFAANVRTMLKHKNDKLVVKKVGKMENRNCFGHNIDQQFEEVVDMLNERDFDVDLPLEEDLDQFGVELQGDSHFFPLIHHHSNAVGSIFGRAAQMVALSRPLTR